jgi:hypothetical protein
MAQWELNFRVDVMRVCRGAYPYRAVEDPNGIQRAISKLELRPIRAVYDDGCVEMSFIIDAESLSEAPAEQRRMHDSLSKTIDEVKLEKTHAIEYDPPLEVEAGTKGP